MGIDLVVGVAGDRLGLADAHAACEHRRSPDRQPAVQQRVQLGDTKGGAPLLRHQIQG